MTHTDLLFQVAQLLDSAGIPYMVAGSGSSFHSQPRATNDVDIIIDPTAAQLDQWLTSLGPQFYADRVIGQDALSQRSMFNIIDLTSGVKVDLVIRKARPFSVEEFQRRSRESLQGHSIPMATPEDIILSKLEWNKITPSERQLRDALNVATMQWPKLDLAYLRKWAPDLEVREDLEALLAEAERAQQASP
jgi:hypothetical protein